MTNTRAEVSFHWADGEHDFALKLPQIDELQRVTAKAVIGMLAAGGLSQSIVAKSSIDASGIGAIYKRLLSGEPLISDVREAIRLGLIGRGMPALRAATMVETYVDGKPLASLDDIRALSAGYHPANADAVSNLSAAIAIVGAVFVGVDEIPSGKKKAGRTNRGTATSTSPQSTEPGAPAEEQRQTSET